MRNAVEAGKSIRSPHDAKTLANSSERNFALMLLKTNPHLQIVREPTFFQGVSEDGRVIGTVPDFHITNPNNPLVPGGVYVEITRGICNGIDPKARQKAVMNQVKPPVQYVVLYGQNLEKIQKAHPDLPLLETKDLELETNIQQSVIFSSS